MLEGTSLTVDAWVFIHSLGHDDEKATELDDHRRNADYEDIKKVLMTEKVESPNQGIGDGLNDDSAEKQDYPFVCPVRRCHYCSTHVSRYYVPSQQDYQLKLTVIY